MVSCAERLQDFKFIKVGMLLALFNLHLLILWTSEYYDDLSALPFQIH